MQIGIIGHGRFGALWASLCAPYADVLVYDTRPLSALSTPASSVRFGSLLDVCHTDIVFLCVPITAIRSVASEILPLVGAGTVMCDVASVKVLPMQWLRDVFADTQPLVFTHPLFGPDSVGRTGIAGKKLVIATESDDRGSRIIANLCEQMGVQTLRTTADDHDMQMARSQALVHCIGRSLAPLSLSAQEIATPDYERLLSMIDLVSHDTMELFVDMQRFNPHAKAIREQFVQSCIALNDMLRQQEGD